MDGQDYIKQTLELYKIPIDSRKKDPYSSSDYSVSKPWGKEEWMELTPHFCLKKISMFAGFQSSLQYHNLKTEINYVLSGSVKLLIGHDEHNLQEKIFGPGDSWVVPVGTVHRVIALTDYVALEASSPHLDDVVRIVDDSNRPSGLIKNEHPC
jgi:mannose-6-phosphate isomerase